MKSELIPLTLPVSSPDVGIQFHYTKHFRPRMALIVEVWRRVCSSDSLRETEEIVKGKWHRSS